METVDEIINMLLNANALPDGTPLLLNYRDDQQWKCLEALEASGLVQSTPNVRFNSLESDRHGCEQIESMPSPASAHVRLAVAAR